MCGIAGKYNLSRNEAVNSHLIKAMCAQIIHRGPDDEGIYVNDNIGLGMRRLSIIDLEGGRQPIFNEDETVVIVYNGETYNFQALKKRLEDRGHRFRTDTDTEVLVHAYEEYGLDFIKYIRGMFAFAIWDETKERLVLARDRMGQKPLYYKLTNETLWFCSEIKSILVDPSVERDIDLKALDYYLTFNYVPAPSTIFKDIKKLPPATMLICENGQTRLQEYWRLDNLTDHSMDEVECAEYLYDLLSESVKIRLISDVPLGAFLSGGIDSSIIVALMAAHSDAPVKTFSIGFTEDEFTELEFARLIANRFATHHHEHIVTSAVEELIPKLNWYFGEPVGDSSAIPTYYLAKMTRQSVTVALSGDGGDELFAGYEKYPIINNIISANGFNRLLRSLVTGSLLDTHTRLFNTHNVFERLKNSIGYRFSTATYRNLMWISHFDYSLKKRLYTPELQHAVSLLQPKIYYETKTQESPNKDVLSQILYMDLKSYLPDDLLIKVDIASMANSLEVRSPFLDHILVNFAAAIPNYLKLSNAGTKHILKRAFSNLLPKEILSRKKMGFAIPVDKWFRSDLKPFSYDVLMCSNSDLMTYFDKKFLRRMLDLHCAGKLNYGSKLWLLINLVVWYELYINNSIITLHNAP